MLSKNDFIFLKEDPRTLNNFNKRKRVFSQENFENKL
jgi:hypothetical protein